MMLMRFATTVPIGTLRPSLRPSFRGDQTAELKSNMTASSAGQRNRVESMFGLRLINRSIATR
jgi:hypothetical protein